MSLSPGTRLGPYEILAPIGTGGMGEVYRARDPRLGREVAIKVLPAFFFAGPGPPEALRAGGALGVGAESPQHHHHSRDQLRRRDDLPRDGARRRDESCASSLASVTSRGAKKLLDVALQIAEGLAKAHGAGIVHRDLKPENVMVFEGRLRQAARLRPGEADSTAPTDQVTGAPTAIQQETQPGTVMGTVGYMSPEQASGRPVDFRSDQFSLGSILYEMATAKRAFQKNTGAETLAAVIRDEPEPVAQVNPRAPAPFRWIVERCLAKDPDERYASTRDLARDLKSVREHLGEVTSTASGVSAVVEPVKRRSLALPIGLAAVILAAAAGALLGRRTAVVSQPTFQRLTFQRGTVSTARFGPDGSSVYYTAAWERRSSEDLLASAGEPGIFRLSRCRRRSCCRSRPPARWRSCSSRTTT